MEFGVLLYARRGGPRQFYQLRLGSQTIGRDPGADLQLDAEGVALLHARVICTPAALLITDLDSSTGTFLNQVRIPANTPQPLRANDNLRIGPFALRYLTELPTSTARTTAVAAGDVAPAEAEATTVIEVPAAAAPPAAPTAVSLPPPDIASSLPVIDPLARPESAGVRRLRGNGRPPAIRRGVRGLPYPENEPSSYLQYLPPPYHDHPFVGQFLKIFESILEPLERMIGQIDHYFDPHLAPEALLPWLATWVDLLLNEQWPIERRRNLLAAAAELYRWRGTRRGLSEYLRIYTGVAPTIIEPDQVRGADTLPAHTFRVILELPPDSAADRALVERIIEAEKPAHTAYQLEIR